jgi:hypothetical protein
VSRDARVARVDNLVHVLDRGLDRRGRPALDPRRPVVLLVAPELALGLFHERACLLAVLVCEGDHRSDDASDPSLGRLLAELRLDTSEVRLEQIGLDGGVAREGEPFRLGCKQPLLEPVRVREDAEDAVRDDRVVLGMEKEAWISHPCIGQGPRVLTMKVRW